MFLSLCSRWSAVRIYARVAFPPFLRALTTAKSKFISKIAEPTSEFSLISFGFSLNHAGQDPQAEDYMKRRQPSPHTFEGNVAAEIARCESQLAKTSHGPERDALEKKIRQLNTAGHMNDWLKSPGLQTPR